MPDNKQSYPSTESIQSAGDYVPIVFPFLRNIFSKKDSDLQVDSIGQAIVQTARRRLSIEPLQIGLAVQLHHMFRSRFLIENVSSMGFCSSYSEIKKFESAVVATNQDTPHALDQSHFLQFVADNVDQNIDTIDGNNTFHGMGIMACATHSKQTSPKEIPRFEVTTEDLISIGHTRVFHYKSDQRGNTFTSMRFQNLQEHRKMNATWKVDVLIKVCWPLTSAIPG